MAVSVSSNFLYQGKHYLDERIEKAKSKKDLKNWSIPVPDGFEIYLEGSWYTWKESNTEDPETGKFKKRSEVTQEFGDSKDITISQASITDRFNKVEVELTDLTNAIFPLEFKIINGGGNYEVGQIIYPTLSWTVGIKGKDEEVSPTYATVNDSTEGVDGVYKSWTGSSEITKEIPGTINYKVKVKYNSQEAEKTIGYNFYYKKFFGTSTSSELDTSEILKLTGKAFITGNSYILGTTKFDCTGGKYPYYVIPKSIYKDSLEFWVGGLKNTDIVIKDVDVITSTGLKITYTTIRLSNIQTGNLSIEIK